tara:strand:- start:366 stop:536 length:171 start_codon:yes stop_codon:yes gene_type:complete
MVPKQKNDLCDRAIFLGKKVNSSQSALKTSNLLINVASDTENFIVKERICSYENIC